MLRFLKSLFGKQEQAAAASAAATVPLAELEDWLRQASAPAHARIVEQLAATRTRIDQLAVSVREKVTVLQNAQLLNPDIPDRAKDYMTGNREEYTRRVAQYLDKIIVPNAAEGLGSFFEQHRQDAAEFTKGILRPFQILQEFFAHESKDITAVLAQMEQEILQLKALHEQAKPEQHQTLRKDIATLLIRKQQLGGLEHERDSMTAQRGEAIRSVKALAGEEERLLKDADRQAALARLEEAHKKMQAHEQAIRDVFTNLEPALRKFHRMATRHVKLAENYLRDPVKSLIEDLHLDILDVLVDIERLMKFDRIPLGDRKEYVRDALNALTKDKLGTWMREYGQLAKNEKAAQQAVEDCAASKTLTRIQRLRDETRRNDQIAEQRLAQVTRDIEKINLAALRAALEQKLQDATGTVVSIIF